ncbi:MAG: hypothetical protein B7Z08_05425 [Sphingomonadales bacterium 32-68-7]|nr:MAG: hypothetical protein B7Z33_01000 [Sphingomonadales bacterium 12-68-11]OYX09437.1 MAG: hypothetical protein B7Z08_05425 [Sphingomonadales bacterium 32-68-7]
MARSTETVPANPYESGLETRRAARFGLVIRPAKLICGRFEFPCVMRDVSETGVSVRLFHPVIDKGPFALEILTGIAYPATLVWQKDLAAGFHFHGPIDIDKILANAGPYPNRPMRLNADMPAVVEFGEHRIDATVINFSQQGARLRCPERLAIGQLVALRSDWLPRLYGKVRWRKDEQYGIVFEETFKLAELSELATRMQAAARAAPAAQRPGPKSTAA